MSTNKINFRPLNDSILLRSITNQYEGSQTIALPDEVVGKMAGAMYGEVVAVGSGPTYKDGTRGIPSVLVGDKVICEKYFVSELELDGEKLFITEGEHIVARITE